ncbi:MAG: glycosyl transferase family 1, partial [Bacteroidota bacterium]|nr:glycosyl transferase family 1 [Bacteroidota bacterium]
MFKVLVIAYYFPPMGLSGVQRTVKFIKYMKKYNWEPTVITTSQPGYFSHDNSLLKEVEDFNIRVIRTDAKNSDTALSNKKTRNIPPEFMSRL